jgi:hypothetical protein
MTPDPAKLAQFVFRAVDGCGNAYDAALVVVGERLGLYRALAAAGGLTAGELAERTSASESYVHEWLSAQAGGGYVGYHPAEDRYSLSPEQAVALTDEDSPAYLPAFFRLALRLRSRSAAATSSRAVQASTSGMRAGSTSLLSRIEMIGSAPISSVSAPVSRS